jgi:prolyl oligopeptidase
MPAFGYGVSPAVKVEAADVCFLRTVPDSPYALGIVMHGAQWEFTLYVAPLDSVGKPGTPWRKVCDVEDAVRAVEVRGDDIYLLTHKGRAALQDHSHQSFPS